MAIDADAIIAAARGWIGTPYLHQASVKGAGCDCLGLLRGVWRDVIGAESQSLPPYSADWGEASGEETLYTAISSVLSKTVLSAIEPGDVVLFRMAPHAPAKHCGIVAEKTGIRTLIHARQNKRVSEEVFSKFWRRKLAFAFRL